MAKKDDWLGPQTKLFKRSITVLGAAAAITVTIIEVDSRVGLGLKRPSLLYSIIQSLAQGSSCLVLAGLGIRAAIWIRDRGY